MRTGFVQRATLIIAGIILFPVVASFGGKAVVSNTNDSGAGSFRQALETCGFAGKDTVVFEIPATDAGYNPSTRVWTIKPTITYTVPKETVVDGTILVPIGGGKNILRPGIEIDGTTLGNQGITGLSLEANVVLRGLIINRFQYGIWVSSSNVTVERCFVGTDPTGQTAKPNGTNGILVIHAATGVVIQSNLISGNQSYGIRISGASATGNVVRNNRIGTDSSGTAVIPNKDGGISLHAGAHDNSIENNLVSGNMGIGIHLYDAGTKGNRIRENRVGTSADGKTPLPNATFGVALFNGPCNNVIGPDNRIAFNGMYGVLVDGSGSFTGTVGNTVTGNSIAANVIKGIFNFRGGNSELAPPAIASVTSSRISGTAGPQQTVAVYLDQNDEGAYFIGSTPADAGGHFVLSVTNPLPGLPSVTATSTDAAGNTSEFSAPFLVSGIEEGTSSGLRVFSLHQNYPNPFNPETMIRYSIPEQTNMLIEIYNIHGNRIAVLKDALENAGNYSVTWDGKNSVNQSVSSGIYFCRIQAGTYQKTIRMLMLK